MVARQHRAAMQEELGEECPLLRASERQEPPLRYGLDGPENPEFRCCARFQVPLKRI